MENDAGSQLEDADTATPLTSKKSGHCLECHNGSHSENRDKATSSKPFRKLSRHNTVRNLNSYDKYIRKHRKRHSYTIAVRALFEGRDNNPAHEEFFNSSLISGLKKKNQCWDRMSVHD